VKLCTYLESASKDLQNDIHISEFCKISYFLLRYKLKVKFLGPKICGIKSFHLFFNGLNIGILMLILVENKISYNLVYEYFNKTLTCDCKIILN
jgi:hypothetical protein